MSFRSIAALSLGIALPANAFAQATPPPESTAAETDAPVPPAKPVADEPGETPAARPDRNREELRREVMEEVRRELARSRQAMRDELSFVEASEEARVHDARQLKELKQVVNLLQLHGYWRMRGDMFRRADLDRGPDAANQQLFPRSPSSDNLSAGNMRLRLNPVLRLSDQLTLHGQFDALDNVLMGSAPLVEPYFDGTTGAQLLTNRVRGEAVQVKRVWAEVETPVGQLAFGRMGLHWGEGLLYNDGNCLDCDYGTTFDRIQLKTGPFFRHVVTVAADSIATGATTNDLFDTATSGRYGVPVNLDGADDAWRYSVAIERRFTPAEARRKLDDGGWVLNYGLLFGYRSQSSVVPALEQVGASGYLKDTTTSSIDAQLFELDLHAQLLVGKLRLSTEWAGLQGGYGNIVGNPDASTARLLGLPVDLLQGAGVVRGQWASLDKDALLIGGDFGIASGDSAPGMGARPGRAGSGPGGDTAVNDIDGRQFCTSSGCSDRAVNNFRVNPDFRIDQLLWRNLFTSITDAWFARAELRYMPSGRSSGGGEDDGLEVGGALVYSQAIFDGSTPGDGKPLGIELDASVSYTARDRFYVALIGGFLLPLSGLNNPLLAGDDGSAKLGQVYRGVLGMTF